MTAIRAFFEGEGGSKAYIMLGIGVVAVSLAAIFIRLAQDSDVPSLVIAGGRVLIAALILTPITLRNNTYLRQIRALTRREAALVGVSGLFLAIHFGAWVTSLEYTTVLISVVIVTTTPIWVSLLEVVLLNARLTRLIFFGLAVSMTGSVIINAGQGTAEFGSETMLRGALLALIGAMAVAVYLIIGRSLRPKLALMPYIWLVYGTAALLLMIVIGLTSTPIAGHSAEGYLWVLAVALIPQLVGHSSLNYALGYLPATYVSIATQAEPIGSAALAVVLFAEIPDVWQIVGSAIILIGVTLATLGQSTPATAPPSSAASIEESSAS